MGAGRFTSIGLLSALVLVQACAMGDPMMGGPGAMPRPPEETAPTGTRWKDVDVTDACGRSRRVWILVDESCGEVDTPGYFESFRAPMFRDGAIVGQHLFAVDASHLWVLDASDPARLERRALWAGFGLPLAVAATGERLVLAAGSEGLVVADVSAPLQPRRVGAASLGAPAFDLSLAGDRAWVAAGALGLAEVRLAEEGPELVRSIATGGFAVGVEVVEGRAYVAACDSFKIVDLASGETLGQTWLSEAHKSGQLVAPAKDVTVNGDLAFVAAGRYGAVAVDVSDPAAPTVLGNVTRARELSYYASGVRQDERMLYIAAGEWGIEPVALATARSKFARTTEPDLFATPDTPGGCGTPGEWTATTTDLGEVPRPGRDPIQTLPVGGHVYAFGDASRIGLRALDVHREEAGALKKVGRYEEPRVVTTVAARDGRVLAIGPRAGLFRADDAALLLPEDSSALPLKPRLGAFAADGRWVTVTEADDLFVEGSGYRISWGTPITGLAIFGDEAVLASELGLLNYGLETKQTRFASAAWKNALKLQVASHGPTLFVSSPEWLSGYRLETSWSTLPPHEIFGQEEVRSLSAWRRAAPRRVLLPTSRGLLEVGNLGTQAGFALHGKATTLRGVLPPGSYEAGAVSETHAFLVASDRRRYRTTVHVLALDGEEPTIVQSHVFSGVGLGAALDGEKLYVADADRGLRVFSQLAGRITPLGTVEIAP